MKRDAYYMHLQAYDLDAKSRRVEEWRERRRKAWIVLCGVLLAAGAGALLWRLL
jgi:hypothetical protein